MEVIEKEKEKNENKIRKSVGGGSLFPFKILLLWQLGDVESYRVPPWLSHLKL